MLGIKNVLVGFTFAFLSYNGSAATFETCHQISTPQVSASLAIYSMYKISPGDPISKEKSGAVDKLLGNFYANSQGRIKIDDLPPGLYKFIYYVGKKVVRSQIKAIIEGYNWLDCTPGLITSSVCSKSSPWVKDCMDYNPGTGFSQCIAWCKAENPEVKVVYPDAADVAGDCSTVDMTTSDDSAIDSGDSGVTIDSGDSGADEDFIIDDSH